MAAKTGGKAADNTTTPDDAKVATDDGSTTDDSKAKATAAAATDDAKATADDASGDQAAKKTRSEKTFSKSDVEAAAKKAVDEAKKKWDEEKDLSESERLKKENEELRNAARLRDARDEVVAALEKVGAKSPALAFNSIRDQLKFGDDGKLLNSKDLIDGLKTDFPEQFGTEKPTETINGGSGQQSGEKLTVEKLAKMTPAEINALPWDEVSKVMAGK